MLISYLIAGTICGLAGLCYAELSSTLPVSGSAYTYSYTTVGEFAAWIMGALLLLEYGLAASVVAVGWAGYVVSLLGDYGIHIPAALTGPAGHALMQGSGTEMKPVLDAAGVPVSASSRGTRSLALDRGISPSATPSVRASQFDGP